MAITGTVVAGQEAVIPLMVVGPRGHNAGIEAVWGEILVRPGSPGGGIPAPF